MPPRAVPVTESCDTLSYAELMAKLGIKKSAFFNWLREGRFDHLRCPAPLQFKFSRVKVEKWLASPSMVTRRFRGAA